MPQERGNKRDRAPNTTPEDEQNVFRRSKLIVRSPNTQKLFGNYEMEEEIRDMKNMMIEMMEEMRKNTKENRDLREELKKREDMWAKEKNALIERIEKLENKLENQEKKERKCNLVIKGLQIEENEKEKSLEKFIKNTMNIETRVKKAFKMNKKGNSDIILAEMETWEEKQAIMTNKSKLRGSAIYIENDMTIEERKIQAEIRKLSRAERERGKRTTIGYKKLFINGIEHVWSDREKRIIKNEESKN